MLIKNTFRMEISSVTEQIKEIFIKIFPKENISLLALDKSQSEFEDWDSFAQMQLITSVESKFNIQIDIDDVISITSADDLLNYVKSHT